MDREGIKKHRAVFDAWLDGAEVETKYSSQHAWHYTGQPDFVKHTEYRVKPVPETREVWVNVYPHRHSDQAYVTRNGANLGALEDRIACVPVTITFTPGEGLDHG
ncbi:hypothetical protein LCGC14_0354870 [marine sediment metagenome]|uniref:Uncharacterized protein n=1 Tax=marine sediment metagenome TaxID=412755 RepID=A0A0F9TSJ0_9ZZZZ